MKGKILHNECIAKKIAFILAVYFLLNERGFIASGGWDVRDLRVCLLAIIQY